MRTIEPLNSGDSLSEEPPNQNQTPPQTPQPKKIVSEDIYPTPQVPTPPPVQQSVPQANQTTPVASPQRPFALYMILACGSIAFIYWVYLIIRVVIDSQVSSLFSNSFPSFSEYLVVSVIILATQAVAILISSLQTFNGNKVALGFLSGAYLMFVAPRLLLYYFAARNFGEIDLTRDFYAEVIVSLILGIAIIVAWIKARGVLS